MSGVKGQGHTLHIVVKPCNHDTDWTVSARTIKLDTHTTYHKRKTPIDFQGQGSKVKNTYYTVLLNFVNMIQTEPFKLGPSNLVHVLLMTRNDTYWFSRLGVKGQGHILNVVVTPCKQGKTLLNSILWRHFPLKFTRRAYFATLSLLLLKLK